MNLLNNLFDRWARADLHAARQWLVKNWADPKLEAEAFSGTLGRLGWGHDNLMDATEAAGSLVTLERIQAESVLWTIPGTREKPVGEGMDVSSVATQEIDDRLTNLERLLDEAEDSGIEREAMAFAIGQRLIGANRSDSVRRIPCERFGSYGSEPVDWLIKFGTARIPKRKLSDSCLRPSPPSGSVGSGRLSARGRSPI